MTAAATSLSRSVASARPGRLRTRLRPYQTASATRTTPEVPEPLEPPVGHAEDDERSGSASEKLKPNRLNGATASPRSRR